MQAHTAFWVATAAAILGVVIVLVGSALLFAGKVAIGVLSAVVGAVTEAVGFLLFQNLRDANKRLDEIHDRIQTYTAVTTVLEVIKRMEDPAERKDALRKLANDLRHLSTAEPPVLHDGPKRQV